MGGAPFPCSCTDEVEKRCVEHGPSLEAENARLYRLLEIADQYAADCDSVYDVDTFITRIHAVAHGDDIAKAWIESRVGWRRP